MVSHNGCCWAAVITRSSRSRRGHSGRGRGGAPEANPSSLGEKVVPPQKSSNFQDVMANPKHGAIFFANAENRNCRWVGHGLINVFAEGLRGDTD